MDNRSLKKSCFTEYKIAILLVAALVILSPYWVVGQQFELFTYEEGSSIGHIKYDEVNNRVWLCEENSFPTLKYFENGSFTEITELISSTSTGMDVGVNGEVWVSTYFGIYLYDGGNLTLFNEDNAPFFSASARAVEVTDDAVYVGFDLELWKWENEEWTEIEGINNYTFSLAYDDASDILYVGGQFGLQKVENDVVTTLDEVPFNAIQQMEMDQVGNLWIRSYDNGMAKFDGNEFTHYNVNNSGLLSDDLSAIGLDAENRVWVSYDAFFIDGLGMFDGGSWIHYNPTNSNFPEDYSVYSITAGEENDLWLGTFGGLIHLTFMNTSLSQNPEFSLTIAPNPVQEEIHLSATENLNGTAIIFSASGRVMMTQDVEAESTINIQDLPKGMYYLKIESQIGQLTKSFVVH